ncbi:hypothetical protein MATL_G00175350 [Megalops atlanticus]|uniref:Ig-like domain-containing protein n=1 Tax=Megalops atlanticus TaxID=7932 RepID=A0A9D3PS74_MEGAT|nr:hypothetical protein MATL_G00175350 [Megalops atlanticus]
MIRLCVTLIMLGKVYTTHANAVVQPNLTMAAAVGETVTLTCIHPTDDFSSIFWFRHTVGQQPQYISCVYKLPKRNLSPSDAGTYYCAVATCGEILFGNGTRLDVQGDAYREVLVYVTGSLGLSLVYV